MTTRWEAKTKNSEGLVRGKREDERCGVKMSDAASTTFILSAWPCRARARPCVAVAAWPLNAPPSWRQRRRPRPARQKCRWRVSRLQLWRGRGHRARRSQGHSRRQVWTCVRSLRFPWPPWWRRARSSPLWNAPPVSPLSMILSFEWECSRHNERAHSMHGSRDTMSAHTRMHGSQTTRNGGAVLLGMHSI